MHIFDFQDTVESTKKSLECMSVTVQEQSQKMEELCEEIEVLIFMRFNLPTLVFLQFEHTHVCHLVMMTVLQHFHH